MCMVVWARMRSLVIILIGGMQGCVYFFCHRKGLQSWDNRAICNDMVESTRPDVAGFNFNAKCATLCSGHGRWCRRSTDTFYACYCRCVYTQIFNVYCGLGFHHIFQDTSFSATIECTTTDQKNSMPQALLHTYERTKYASDILGNRIDLCWSLTFVKFQVHGCSGQLDGW